MSTPDETYLKKQTEAVNEAIRLLERLKGSLATGVRVTGGFEEAHSVLNDLKDTLSDISLPNREGDTWSIS